jgi:hypothetical protein
VATVISDLYRRMPGTARPSRRQAQGAWAAVSTLRQETDFPLIVGAYTAAEWTLEVSDLRPLARAGLSWDDVDRLAVRDDATVLHVADPDTIGSELLTIIEVLDGRRGGDESVARGAYLWLSWWVGLRDLPEQFMPGSPAFEELRGHC